MNLDAIPGGPNPPYEVNVFVEVPVGGDPIKYELDEKAGILVVNRFVYARMGYPGNYGFIPHTLSGDGDSLRRDRCQFACDPSRRAAKLQGHWRIADAR